MVPDRRRPLGACRRCLGSRGSARRRRGFTPRPTCRSIPAPLRVHRLGWAVPGGLPPLRGSRQHLRLQPTEIDLRQFIPLLHNNWIIALQARANLTRAAQGQQVPFFMLPSIGGRDTLPGFENYRFTDNDSLLLRSELRWTPTSLVDTAVFLDQGTVAANTGDLDLQSLKRSWGFGVRFHGPTFTALRLEMAHSVEGWRYNIAHTVSF